MFAENHLDRFGRPDVADRVCALVGRPQLRRLGRDTAVVCQRGQRLQRMAQHVQPGTRRCHLRQRPRIVGIQNTELRPQCPVGDSSLYMHLRQIADGDACSLAASACRRRHGNMRPQRPGYGDPFANRRVDVVQKFSWIRGIKIGRLCRIHGRPAPPPKGTRQSCLHGQIRWPPEMTRP